MQNPIIIVRSLAILLSFTLALGCGPADELQEGAECEAQPGPRSAQLCYARDDARYLRVVQELEDRIAFQGADSALARAEVLALREELTECGALPDTAKRPSQEELATWQCRREALRMQLARRLVK